MDEERKGIVKSERYAVNRELLLAAVLTLSFPDSEPCALVSGSVRSYSEAELSRVEMSL